VTAVAAASITALRELDPEPVAASVSRYGARLVVVPDGAPIPHTYWGAPEAGLAGEDIYVRSDTPAHSLLHELGHYVCMSAARRRALVRDAGGDADEECAVCYLQILLAEGLPGFGREKALDDMDAWGYSFREGSARAWWRGDARYARAWLMQHGLIDANGRVTWRLRERP
jgi:hypothetical protein